MHGAALAVPIVVGSLVLLGVILKLAFAAVGKAAEREMVELTAEGIVLDSGKVYLRASFENFRGPMVYIGVGSNRGPTRVVLTQRRFTFVPSGKNRFGFTRMDRSELARFTVQVSEGQLLMHTIDPPRASGTVDLLLSVSDPENWVRALLEAGARPA